MLKNFIPENPRALDGPDWMQRRREQALEQLTGIAWPTTKDEIWRYSRIDELDLDTFRPVTIGDIGAPGVAKAPGGGPVAAEAGEHAGLVVVRNGRVVHAELDSELETKGVRVCSFASLEDEALIGRVGSCVSDSSDAFTTLQQAFLPDGSFVYVPSGVVVDRPIVIVHWAEGNDEASFPHTVVVVEDGGECAIVERFSSGQTRHLVDAVVELQIEDNAHVRYLTVQDHGSQTWHIGVQRAHVGRDATLATSAVALGGDYARLRSESLLTGENAQSTQLAVYFGADSQTLDFRTLQDHDAPRTESDLLFKGAVEDEAQSVYSGLVRLRPSAQKANAAQTNRNLVLTEGAGAQSIPNLEIEANDVRCTHASAVGPIDEEQLFYLESRGIKPADAERLIVLGFFEDVFDRLPIPSLVSTLRRSVAAKVGRLGATNG